MPLSVEQRLERVEAEVGRLRKELENVRDVRSDKDLWREKIVVAATRQHRSPSAWLAWSEAQGIPWKITKATLSTIGAAASASAVPLASDSSREDRGGGEQRRT